MELIIVIIIVSIAAVPLLGQFQVAGNSLVSNDDMQTAQQSAQACAEHLLGVRRRNPSTGFTQISTTSCNMLALPAGFTRALNVVSVTGTATTACPNGASCKNVAISVAKGTLSADIALFLTNY